MADPVGKQQSAKQTVKETAKEVSKQAVKAKAETSKAKAEVLKAEKVKAEASKAEGTKAVKLKVENPKTEALRIEKAKTVKTVNEKPAEPTVDFAADPNNYVNRELSWLEFNYRVLSEARDKSLPLFERLKFLSITASNLDEFYMVRVASLKDMVHAKYTKPDIAGLTPQEQLDKIREDTSAGRNAVFHL